MVSGRHLTQAVTGSGSVGVLLQHRLNLVGVHEVRDDFDGRGGAFQLGRELSTRSFMLAVPLALPASEVVTLTSTPRSAATDSTLTFNSTDVPMPLPHTQRMFMIPSFLSLE